MMPDPSWFATARIFIPAQEGNRLVAYRCPAGKWTIGPGLTRLNGRPIQPGQRITQAEADAGLDFELRQTEALFRRVVRVMLGDNEATALASFSYNEGGAALTSSTLLRKLNANDMAGAAAEFPKWDKMHVDGALVQNKGLHDRRLREQALFLGRPMGLALGVTSPDIDWSDVA